MFAFAHSHPINLGGEPCVCVGVSPHKLRVGIVSELAHFPRTISSPPVTPIIQVNRSRYLEGLHHRTHQCFPVCVFVQEDVSQRLHLERYAWITALTRHFRDICPFVVTYGAHSEGFRADDELGGVEPPHVHPSSSPELSPAGDCGSGVRLKPSGVIGSLDD
jgi:hypothetical protein